ncbi:MAG: glutathione S-transferase family protein [Methylovirgula sp.]
MIVLYTFGPYFGLPDASPFVMKAMMLLKLAGLAYTENREGYAKAPKGKLPYIDDDGEIICDSTFIRFHIEKKYGFDFDAGLTAEQRALAWAIEKMCDEHLYFVGIDIRWRDPENFRKGPAHFFDFVPAAVRPVVRNMIRRKVVKGLVAQGFGRHSKAEIAELGIRDVEALAAILGEKPYLIGDRPCAADAAVFSFLVGLLAPTFDSEVRAAAERHVNLVAYVKRMMSAYFPAENSAAPVG